MPLSSERECFSETLVPSISLRAVLTQITTLRRFIIYIYKKKFTTSENYKQSDVKYCLNYEFIIINYV
jgi:hypothetical protein